jgi:septal ring factor EnvC (AmiA/AmiB activator)
MPELSNESAQLLATYELNTADRIKEMHRDMIGAINATVLDLKEEIRRQFDEIKARQDRHDEKLEELATSQAGMYRDLEHGEKQFAKMEAELQSLRQQLHGGAINDGRRDERLKDLQARVEALEADSQRGWFFRLWPGRGPK